MTEWRVDGRQSWNGRLIRLAAVAFAAAVALPVLASATPIETTGEPGSPSATTTISGKQLPAPEPKFGGVIKEDALKSKADVKAMELRVGWRRWYSSRQPQQRRRFTSSTFSRVSISSLLAPARPLQ